MQKLVSYKVVYQITGGEKPHIFLPSVIHIAENMLEDNFVKKLQYIRMIQVMSKLRGILFLIKLDAVTRIVI